ncbi:type IV conjugative transfer system protein TraV [Enterovibrio norvegicus]|uniref:Type IV conjugative transfer system protein TraV n=1 Tax=Enterovibrio norvegicus TaxID=188144 RepID=A0ABV4L740_9GAMM
MKILSLLFFMALLSGCSAGFQDEFSCQKIGGISGCSSMDEIRNIPTSPSSSTVSVDGSTIQVSPFAFLPRRTREGHPTRTQDTVRKVVVFPFKSDDTKTYIDTLDLYILLDESQWSGRPVQSIKKD